MRSNLQHPVSHRTDRGVALVIVLAFLVLISTLVIAFLSSVQIEVQSSSHYGASVASKQLVQSALHLAMGQVSDGTKSTKIPGSTVATNRIAWASQPGMIRTWDMDGNGWKVFKLYSSRNMVEDFKNGIYSTTTELAQEVPGDWPAKPALFVDLNQPVLVPDTAGAIVRDASKFRAEYPIVDPLALGVQANFTDRVDGFHLEVPPGFGGTTSTDTRTNLLQPKVTASTDPTTTSQTGKTGNPAPMPVVWIYVLKDGTLTVPSGTTNSGRTATWSTGPYAPTAGNPIVGRFAFWADDETCKLNINTASEPTPWDTPRAASFRDFNNGKFQPQNKEYQRYSGHPAMTALSPVFLPGKTLTATDKESIYQLIPRVRNGGSTAGTVAIADPPPPMTPESERLFANFDEFLFDPTRTALSTGSVIDPERLKRTRFFLTANSRAPEVNLFGGPRLSLWPVSTGARSAYDTLASFCATLGSAASGTAREYYFQRGDTQGNPASGANSATSDYTNIPRNQKLYTYLKNVTGDTFTGIPGFGGSFKTAWGADREQVLTEIFDYIRCINLKDNQTGGARFTQGDKGQVVPIEIGNTRGFGRIHTISQFGIHFICNQDDEKRDPPVATTALPAGERQVQAAILFSPFSVSLGWAALYENMFVEVTIDKDVKVGSETLYAAGTVKTVKLDHSNRDGYHLNDRSRGGILGFRGVLSKNGGPSYPLISNKVTLKGILPAAPTMNFSGADLTVKVYAGAAVDASKLLQTFSISMPPATLPAPSLVLTGTEAYLGAGTTAASFWWSFGRFGSLGSHPLAPGAEYRDPNRRWGANGNDQPPGFKTGCMFRAEDVVRSVVPSHGDIRLVAAKKVIDKTVFVPIGDSYYDSKVHFSHVFEEMCGAHLLYGFGNEPSGGTQLAADPAPEQKDRTVGTIAIAKDGDQLTAAKYHWSKMPEIRPGAGKQFNQFGDFDNGIAQSEDGSYINKPDEGTQSGTWPYFQWNYGALNSGYFSPNRLVASAGMLGSLPTGVLRHSATTPHAWRTLLFRPQKGHPGDAAYQDPTIAKAAANKAPDHLIMDLFWMPVVEPYAISEPFSTAGKINLNYEIAPFSYIKRATALHGLMKSEEPLAVPNDASDIYKLADHETASNLLPDNGARGCVDPAVRSKWVRYARSDTSPMRRALDVDQTLTQFDRRFKAGEIFRSATQLCEVHLVSKGATLSQYEQTVKVNGADVPKFWNDHVVTGDNARERPYSNLYARATTKSNVFNVHIRAQVLRKATTTAPAEWNEDRDRVVSEYRGSTIIERYIDAGDSTLPDFGATSAASLDANYRFRQVSTKKFAP